MHNFIKAYKNYATFSGRATRSEYWQFQLIHLITLIVLALLSGVAGDYVATFFTALFFIFFFTSLIPNIAVTVRRLHDTNRSGGWIFIQLLPYVGVIWLLVLLVLDSQLGENKYGANPKNQVRAVVENS